VTVGSAHEGEERTTERIFVQASLSFALLESFFPIGRGELEDAALGPVGEQVEEISEVSPGLEPVHFAAGDEGNEDGIGEGAVVGADEEPVFSADSFATQVSLGDVVRDGESAVVEEALESRLLIEGVADGSGDRGLVEDEVFLRVTPGEEVLDDGARLLVACGLFLFAGRVRDGPLDAKERADVREGLLGSLGVGLERLEEVAACVEPASDRSSLGRENDM
jgi:hypothetical protein